MNVKEILKEQRENWEKLAASMEQTSETESAKSSKEFEDLKRFILEIMFDKHHLVSTTTRKGVLTVNMY